MHALAADYHICPHYFSLAYWYKSIRIDGLELVLYGYNCFRLMSGVHVVV